MHNYRAMYRSKRKSPAEIARVVESDFVCFSPGVLCEPLGLSRAIGEHVLAKGLTGVQHHATHAINGRFLDADLAGRYYYVSWFTAGKAREGVLAGRHDVMPCFYYDAPRLWEDYLPAPDIFYAAVAPMDRHGYFSLGLTSGEAMTLFPKARYVFLEVNKYIPRVLGSHILHISEIDAVCEYHAELPTVPPDIPNLSDIQMGRMIANQIPDGAIIQLGIGNIPSAVGAALSTHNDLGIHSEMMNDCLMHLIEAGVVTNRSKKFDKGKSIAAFAFGSKELYSFIDDNPGVEFRDVEYVNNPNVIGRHDNMISISSCMEVDLMGQVCSESIGWRNYSGTGGQVDYVRGAAISRGGKSFMVMNSTAKRGTISKIKPILTPGAVVTTSKNEVDRVVTEYGIAELKGKTVGQRARALISIAHPDFRDELLAEAKRMNLMV